MGSYGEGDGQDIWIWGTNGFHTNFLLGTISPEIASRRCTGYRTHRPRHKMVELSINQHNFQCGGSSDYFPIPLCPITSSDLLIWRATSTGEFSIRSAYHMEKELQIMRRGGGSKQGDGNVV